MPRYEGTLEVTTMQKRVCVNFKQAVSGNQCRYINSGVTYALNKGKGQSLEEKRENMKT